MVLPKRVFNSPLIRYTNFEDNTFVNLIKLNKPYANGDSYAVYETTKSPFCSSGMFKTLEKATEKYNTIVRNARVKVIKTETLERLYEEAKTPFKATPDQEEVKRLINMFLDWTNNFITLERFSEYYNLSFEKANEVINQGRQLNEKATI